MCSSDLHTLLLSVGNDTVSVDYVDPHTILVHSDGESLNTPWANLFRRTSTEPLRAGWTREMSNVRIEVIEAAPEGSPRLTKFTFKEPLDSAKLHWLTWAGDRYAPFSLPSLGERMELAARPFVPVGKSEFRPVRAEVGERDEVRAALRVRRGNEVEDVAEMARRHPLMSDYWRDKRPDLRNVQAAAYVAASWSNPIHTRGTLDAFAELPSDRTWLRIHDTQEWIDLADPASVADLRRFFDRFLKEIGRAHV